MEELSIGQTIDKLYALRAERLALSKQIEDMKAQESKLRVIIITQLRDIGLDGGKGSLATASITTSREARVTDWHALWNWMKEHDAFDMVQKRVAVTAARARWDEGVAIDGVEEFELDDLSLTKRK